MYKELNSWDSNRTNEEIFNSFKDCDWFVENNSETMTENCIKLYTDEGKVWQIWAPRCGYFESLYGAKIISEESDMEFTV